MSVKIKKRSLCNANTDAGITSASTFIINQLVYVPIKIANAMQFAVRWAT